MKTLQIRRLAVLDKEKNLVGIVSLGDIATEPRAANSREVARRSPKSPNRRDRISKLLLPENGVIPSAARDL